jgi:hypothetical protein
MWNLVWLGGVLIVSRCTAFDKVEVDQNRGNKKVESRRLQILDKTLQKM